MNKEIRLCKSQEELAAAFRIRGLVFIDEQHTTADIEIDEEDKTCERFLLFIDNKAVAVLRVLYKETPIIGRLAVLKEERNKGYAAILINYIHDYLKDKGYKEVVLHAQIQAQGFYEKEGYKPFGEHFMEADIEHVMMRKEL